MMFELLILKLILSFVVAGIWITIATVISERLGSKIGGIIAALPSTSVVSLLFIGWTQSPEAALRAAQVIPLSMAICSVFLFVFIATAKKGKWFPFAVSLSVWTVLSLILGFSGYSDLLVGSVIFLIVSIVLFLIIEIRFNVPSIQAKTKRKYSVSELCFRFILSGGAVSISVALAAISGPIWGGIFISFPAATLSTMYLLTLSDGADFARATGKLMLFAYASIIVYSLSVSITFLSLGLIFGSVVSYFFSVLFVIVFSPLLKRIS